MYYTQHGGTESTEDTEEGDMNMFSLREVESPATVIGNTEYVKLTIVTLPFLPFSVYSVPSVPPCWMESPRLFVKQREMAKRAPEGHVVIRP